ncbi:topoisomerase II-associated protein PAT1 [Tuber borchii]|uniref:Topoisomerase II-associated protein PAT1 n=1 Tax=Tuber borchii TaxID=42251 RepID=A0A2T6ZVC1_TUBBO|nr:topoisomerase II-associated protein PAT1 [Tuber borchii]
MSFFGFDTSLPRDRGHPAMAPGFSQATDHFAGLSNADDDDDDGIDFEDTYDGLGDKLDEKDDAFNDETFGAPEEAIGKDFDFHGATARVADAMEEEHEVFNRSARNQSVARVAAAPTQPARVEPPTHVPVLRPDMSLWGSGPATTPQPEPQPDPTPVVPPVGRKILSLEEVEAQILANNEQKHQSSFQQPPAQAHQLPPQHQHTPPIVTPQLHQYPPPQHDLHQLQSQQFPARIQSMLQRNQTPPQVQHRQIPEQHPGGVPLQQQRMQPVAQPLHPSRNQYGMTNHVPTPQLQKMTEAEKARFLEEESKRLKRNHKIAQLARYNGLMTPADKNFITRIQLQHLVSINNAEDNANEDFYYIVHSAIRARTNPQQPLNQFAQTYLFRQSARGRNRQQDNHLQRMEQQVQRAVAAAKARPKASQLVLEGSLGKISFSNVKTPRPMLNIKKSDTSGGEPIRRTQRSTFSSADRKSLLRAIENVYDALLELEVHERERAKLPILMPDQQPQQAHVEWSTRRDQLVAKLWKETKIMEPIDPMSTATHPFIAILSYSKMKRAVQRIFRHLDPEQRVTVLTMIVVHLDILDVVKHGVYLPDETQLPSAVREEIEMFAASVLPPLLGYVYEAPLSIVIGLLGILLERVDVVAVSKTKIGLAFLTMFSSRAEIVKQAGGAPENELQQWQMMYDRLFDSLQGHWMECFPPGMFVDDVYVWQFLASIAVGANMPQQQALVSAVKDRVMENVRASKTLPPELGAQKSANVNLFMRAIGLDVELLG